MIAVAMSNAKLNICACDHLDFHFAAVTVIKWPDTTPSVLCAILCIYAHNFSRLTNIVEVDWFVKHFVHCQSQINYCRRYKQQTI